MDKNMVGLIYEPVRDSSSRGNMVETLDGQEWAGNATDVTVDILTTRVEAPVRKLDAKWQLSSMIREDHTGAQLVREEVLLDERGEPLREASKPWITTLSERFQDDPEFHRVVAVAEQAFAQCLEESRFEPSDVITRDYIAGQIANALTAEGYGQCKVEVRADEYGGRERWDVDIYMIPAQPVDSIRIKEVIVPGGTAFLDQRSQSDLFEWAGMEMPAREGTFEEHLIHAASDVRVFDALLEHFSDAEDPYFEAVKSLFNAAKMRLDTIAEMGVQEFANACREADAGYDDVIESDFYQI